MTKAEIIHTQKRIGVVPDSFWGAISTKAAQDHLRKLMPDPHPFPTYAQRLSFYGFYGVKNGFTPPMKRFTPPYAMRLYGANGDRLTHISAHVKCADSLEQALVDIADTFTADEIKHHGLDLFFGVYNPRTVRGSSTAISNHSWAAAIDLDANRNKNKSHWPTQSKMPIEAMECFARAGWTAAGAAWNRDGMHFESVRS